MLVEVLQDLGDLSWFGLLLEPDVDGREDSTRDRQKVRSELDLVRLEMKLFEEFAGVSMAEDRVGGEIVRGVHEVGGAGGSSFSGAADSGFGVADDAVVDIGEAGLKERGECEDDRGRVAAGLATRRAWRMASR